MRDRELAHPRLVMQRIGEELLADARAALRSEKEEGAGGAGRRDLLTLLVKANAEDAPGARLVDHMRHDKKASGGVLPFLLARGIGQAFLDRSVDLADVAAFLDEERCRTA